MALIGYARVSTRDQHLDSQLDVLTRAGCVRIFQDTASGTLARRPQLDAALAFLRAGDVLVVTRLDRLGRSVKHLKDVAEFLQNQGVGLQALEQGIDTSSAGGRLFFHMLAAIAEFERDLISDRTRDGLAAARARGRHGGRPQKLTPAKIAKARQWYDAGQMTVDEIGKALGVSRATIYRALSPRG